MSICVSRAFCSKDYKEKRETAHSLDNSALPDPDLEIRGRGWGAVIQTLRKGGVSKKFFRPLGPQFCLKITGAWP